jgi:hypothetical protein
MAIKISGTTVINDSQKFLQPGRISTATTTTSLAPNTDTYDTYLLTAQASNLAITADTGSGQYDGQRLLFRVTPTSSSLTITFSTGSTKTYRLLDVAIPSSTIANKTIYFGCVWSAAASRWDIIACSQEF